MRRMTAKEVERQLGLQYAQALRENPQFASVRKDCEDVINGSLSLLEHYNKVSMAIKNKTSGAAAALFS